jgi:hypothetical protein
MIIKLSSGKEIDLTRDELCELFRKCAYSDYFGNTPIPYKHVQYHPSPIIVTSNAGIPTL